MKALLIVISVFLLSSCVDDDESKSSVLKRASFDLSCPETQIEPIELSRNDGGHINSYGVNGCGKKAVYVKPVWDDYWLLNLDSNKSSEL